MSTNSKVKTRNKNILLLIVTVILIITPLILNSTAEYGGADGEAESLISEINPNYKPWFNSLYEPPSGEIESLLFSTQAAIGAGIIGYFLGYKKGKKDKC
ncbi:energy-coupling factor ABC transporter substrate-binding protein [Paraclostridium bifermentans]|jgi:cobalt/nickel transport protein|uniref:energy-coupling factor ABC transporter substrate-binding protein n=1 Tax=Paraclostridium bifermentans TaxID=1490 RepID=UPI000DF84B6A|nr:energy-coupling factor ABC transporter substrate-binding protein [Paraclostridium bifermentans]RDC50858.1 energy-coupling factor ABC transporter substrate-binding protein [Acinetobacter sp. RIT592]MBS5954715.1 energy-coupling factor ABC transporter substrate-binding protein [Paraclostridium bifermentans]MBS6508155.1 energy-coupling factor ABC transporter substrate-binding protein [Paraclostridium bifermentans]MBU5289033.1 energy-coupling factor ABC transporter substrate-binding protein [Para